MTANSNLHHRHSGPAGFRTCSSRSHKTTASLLTEPCSFYRSKTLGLTKSDEQLTGISGGTGDQETEGNRSSRHLLPFDNKDWLRGPPKFRPSTFNTRCQVQFSFTLILLSYGAYFDQFIRYNCLTIQGF